MGNALDYIPAITMGTNASQITGVSQDGFVASGYASLIFSLTGKMPQLVRLPNNRARILVSKDQAKVLSKWLDGQVKSTVKILGKPSTLELETNPFVMPVLLKYAIPAALAFAALGWFAHSFFKR